ncbi:hypothetical protein Lal_00001223 [Lupinus albus]|nr:hypothetical protein Lal_00001223 [Lupinus albus]
MSIQNPGSTIAYSFFSVAIFGNTSFSIEVGLTLIRSKTEGFNSLSSMGLVEFNHFFKWVLANNVTVENKKWLSRVIYQLIPGKSQGTCSPEWFSFLRTCDFDAELCFKLLQEIQHHLQEEVSPK